MMDSMLGQSAAFIALRERLRRYAACDVPVLIEGETGSGKELAAREIHYASSRSGSPFVPVNCGALPDNLIENELFGHERGAYTDAKCAQRGLVDHASGGTLFLDEVDTLSAKAQVTLLRFLENSEFRPIGGSHARISTARIIAATNSRLEQRVADGLFRNDLQYRLNVLRVRLPSLRERADDIPLLAEHFASDVAQRLRGPPKQWSKNALRELIAYAWPGNVRELENVVLRAYLRTDGAVIELDAEDLALTSPELAEDFAESSIDGNFISAKTHAIQAFEYRYLSRLMRRACGNVSAAARMSGTERRQLGRLLKKHGIQTTQFRCQ